MLVFPNFAANLAQTEDVVTKYADIVQSEALLGLPLSGKKKISTQRQWEISTFGALIMSPNYPDDYPNNYEEVILVFTCFPHDA